MTDHSQPGTEAPPVKDEFSPLPPPTHPQLGLQRLHLPLQALVRLPLEEYRIVTQQVCALRCRRRCRRWSTSSRPRACQVFAVAVGRAVLCCCCSLRALKLVAVADSAATLAPLRLPS